MLDMLDFILSCVLLFGVPDVFSGILLFFPERVNSIDSLFPCFICFVSCGVFSIEVVCGSEIFKARYCAGFEGVS